MNAIIEQSDESLKEVKTIIGVDRGINNIATLSNGENFSSQKIQSVRKKFFELRQALQFRRTSSARRHLRKLAGKERRFQMDINHQISKQIVRIAEKSESAIALENLRGIRKNAKCRKIQRKALHNWAFYQLQEFIEYKARRIGIPVVFVNPAYTSQLCSACGKLGDRSGAHFSCPSCGFKADADFNAAYNIALRAAFNQPIVVSVEAKGSKEQLRPSLATIS